MNVFWLIRNWAFEAGLAMDYGSDRDKIFHVVMFPFALVGQLLVLPFSCGVGLYLLLRQRRHPKGGKGE